MTTTTQTTTQGFTREEWLAHIFGQKSLAPAATPSVGQSREEWLAHISGGTLATRPTEEA